MIVITEDSSFALRILIDWLITIHHLSRIVIEGFPVGVALQSAHAVQDAFLLTLFGWALPRKLPLPSLSRPALAGLVGLHFALL